LAFFVNSIVFLLIGDQIRFVILGENLGTIAVTVGAMTLTRAIAIYGLGGLSNWLAKSQISLGDQTVLWWGGLRGSVSIALALSVPATLLGEEEIIATVFGVVLFTLLIQGLTTKPLLEKLGLLDEPSVRQEYLEAIARWVAFNRILKHLTQTDNRPEIDPEYYRYQKALVEGQLNQLQEEINKLRNQYPHLGNFGAERLQDELLAIEADTYAEFVRAGRLSGKLSPLLQEVLTDMDEKLV
jgi:CPA1 family monovalent cation:H+ antiporter